MKRFGPNQELTIEIKRIGNTSEPVLIIDDFLSDPDALVDNAAQSQDWHDLPPGGYPGRRAALPRPYVQSVLRRLDGPIRKHLVGQKTRLDRFECSYSMVTQAPNDLTALQRVPHIDIARENRVAILHYLCDPRFGGTAFFRQNATGFEQIGPRNRVSYLNARSEGLEALRTKHTYPDDKTPGYERTGFTEASFNRLVIYRSFTLHSGIIDAPSRLTDDPRTGRLTANFFVDYVRADH